MGVANDEKKGKYEQIKVEKNAAVESKKEKDDCSLEANEKMAIGRDAVMLVTPSHQTML